MRIAVSSRCAAYLCVAEQHKSVRRCQDNPGGGAYLSKSGMGTHQYSSGTSKHSPGTNKHSPGTDKHSPGVSKHSSETSKCCSGTNRCSSGTNKHSPGTRRCCSGTRRYAPGTTKCSSGTTGAVLVRVGAFPSTALAFVVPPLGGSGAADKQLAW